MTEARVMGLTRLPDLVPERWTSGLERAERAVAAADRCGDPNLRASNRICLSWSMLSRGDLEGARRLVDESLAIAVDDAAPMSEWAARSNASNFHIYDGDLEQAAKENDGALEFGLEIGAVDAESWWAAASAQVGVVRDGDIGDPDLIGRMADEFSGAPVWRVAQATALASRQRFTECRDLIDRYDLDDLESVPKDAFWLAHANNLARVARDLNDAPMARRVLPFVEPYADVAVHYCIGFNGPVRQVLAYLRATAGDLEGGIADNRAALEFSTTRNLAPYEAMYRVELAELLVRRGSDVDIGEAGSLISEALPDIDRMGMVGWRTRATQLVDQLG
ncbi:MAG: hypothetical protein M5U31_05060 [Acidimicrobiia bacterium]|nr:hypothetical protein [Acidimicrobiia bacterium]